MGGRRLGDPAGMLRHVVRRTDLGGARGLPLGDRVRLGPPARDCPWHPCDGCWFSCRYSPSSASSQWDLRTSRTPWSSLSSSSTQRGGRRPSGSAVAWPSPCCSRRCRHRAAGSLRVGSDRIWRGRWQARRLRSASSSAAWRRSTVQTSPTPGGSLGADFAGRLRPPPRPEHLDLSRAERSYPRRSPHPLVSVVTPVFNGEKYLRACIESVWLKRTTIGTTRSSTIAARIARWRSRTSTPRRTRRSTVRSNTHFVGVIENHNRAFRSIATEAKYCKLVSADDWIYPECISKLVDFAERHPSVAIVGSYSANATGIRWGGIRSTRRSSRGPEAARLCLLGAIDSFWSPSTVLYRASMVRPQTILPGICAER